MLSRQLADCYKRQTPNSTHRKCLRKESIRHDRYKSQYFGTEIEMTGITSNVLQKLC